MNNFNGNSNVNNEEDRDNFFKLTQLIGVNIQKILQNGNTIINIYKVQILIFILHTNENIIYFI